MTTNPIAMKRRQFIRNTALGSLALGLTPADGYAADPRTDMPKRVLGRTGASLSVIGFGGIMLNDFPQQYANDMVAQSMEAGINYYDISPLYGNAEEKLGPALKPYRNQVFLACKTQEREAAAAEKQLEQSLRLFGTDRVDLYQLHALSSVHEVEQAFAPGGAMELLVKARAQGKIRFLGFSAHSVDAALLAMARFEFDTILFPFNFNSWKHGNFGPQVFDMARSKGMGILALKAMALTLLKEGEKKHYKNVWYHPVEEDDIMKMALRYTLSKEITSAIPPGDASFFWKAVDVARNFSPITPEETERLYSYAAGQVPVFTHNPA